MLSKLHAVEEKSLVLSNQLPLGSCFVSTVLGMGDTKRSQQRQRPCSQSVLLNREIMNAASCQQLLCLVHSKGHLFDFFNISTAISRMPKLVHAAPLHYGDPGAIDLGLGSLKANSLQSPGNLDKVGRELAASLANLMVNQVHLFDARGLANSAWAFAKIRHVPLPGLPTMIAEEAAKKMRDFGAQNISNLAWSFVYMHHRDVYVLDMMAQQILVRLDDFKPQELSNVMWAFASLDYLNSHTLEALSKKAVAMAPYFKEQELSNVIWAFGRLQYNCPHALSALLGEAGAKLHILHPQGVANIAWSMAALWGNQDCDLKQLRARSSAAAALLPGLAAYSRGRLKEFDCQSLSFLCWGLCTLGCSDTRLMDDIVEEAAIRTEALILQPNVFSGMLANRAAMGVPVLHQSHLKSWEATVSRALPTCEEHIAHSLCDSLRRLQGSASLNMPSSSATSYFHSRLSDLQGSSEPASTIRSLSKPFDSHDVGNMQGVTLPEDLDGPWPDYDLCDASQIALPTGLMSLQDETECLMVVTRKSQDRKVRLGAKVYGGYEIQPEHKLSTDNLVSLPGLGFDTFFKMQDEHVSAPAVGLDDEFGWQHSGCAQDLQRRWLSGLLKNDDLPSWQPGHASGDERECKGVIMGHSGLWEQSSRGPAWMISGDHLHGGTSSRFPKKCLSSSSISSSASSLVLSVEQLLPQHLVAEIGWYH
ncbi:hypothetical protein CEUSTIGMA_g933.t1 [Chlamydomonas eustigma]|uniref:RNA-editing substrate-binding complex 6 protein domain-containing protein n=1 Tax=Chlamydomonas eustigma TaxID=1157962 RepID=A0A250WRQ9_9CHLO|nr:hypothetical protein CEUSTIGMA_g933.t1 [Chlamydomonas eustigma]|eukprot:GAX73481.1 hypothetical protein CEUSTIGMA_g933.t1 [Chlamydomonas eustigma]